MFSVCRRILISANICMNEWLILAEVDSIQLPSKPSGLQNPANPIKAATYSLPKSAHVHVCFKGVNKL